VDITRLQRMTATQEHLDKRYEERNVNTGLQIQDDGDNSTRQKWMELSGLWIMIHWE